MKTPEMIKMLRYCGTAARDPKSCLNCPGGGVIGCGSRLREAADRLEQMADALKKAHGCDGCAHRDCDFDQEPCNSCRKDGNFPKWEWKGGMNHESL